MDRPHQKFDHQRNYEKKPKVKYVAKDQLHEQIKKPQEESKSKGVSYQPEKKQYAYQNQNHRKYQQRQEQSSKPPRFIEKKSSEQSINCLICSQIIKRKQSIWTCQSCCISLHLKCIKQWIRKTNEIKPEEETRFIFNWSCIQCKNQYNETMPQYYCFCGKFKNPEYQRDLQPHSCGKPCQKKRGNYCQHPCPKLCHSGKCPPCQHQGALVKCNCGKTSRMAKCSEERSVFQCGKKCEKLLNCNKHKCEKNCHNGDCLPCKKKHLVQCYCGKNEDVVDCWEKSFTCQSVCEKQLNCSFHKCESDCHAGSCGQCKKSPKYQRTCPCGRYQLMMISQLDRQTCQDPIPSCGMPCKKKLNCGHQCPKMCHQGRCPDCRIVVTQPCRCGATQRKIECWKTKAKDEFHCDTVCKKKRNCGIHLCNTQCCRYKNLVGDTHQCQLTCQRILNCQKHTCDLPCHAGLCKKCPVIYSQAQPCPCGSTSLKPPIICGTQTPECDNFCQKLMPCGHKCDSICHYGQCKCREEVFVTCRCGIEQIKTTCGREALCLNKCQNLLQCGHKCLVQCHEGTCKQANKDGCFKKCDRDRKDCGHKCKQICHINKKCQQFPCEAQILIKCQCGHRQTSVLCESHGINDGAIKMKQILCNKKCENMKRFDIIYKGKQIYYPNSLMQYGFKNFNFLQRIQQRLEKFISSSESHFIEIEYKQTGDHLGKIALHTLFENHYHLNTHYYKYSKTATFTLTQTDSTMIPKPCLSEYIKQVAKGYIKRTNLPFQFTIKFDQSKQKADQIVKSLKEYMHKYYVEKKDRMFHIHFWNKEDGLEAREKLQQENGTVQFYVEENRFQDMEEQIELDEIVERQVLKQDKEGVEIPLKQSEKIENADQRNEKQLQIEKNEKKAQKQVKDREEMKQQSVQSQTGQNVSVKAQPKIQQREEENEGKKIGGHENKQEKLDKPKIIIKDAPKIIFKKGAPNFVRSEFPPSKETVQDIYIIDNDELFNEKVDWDLTIKQLLSKKMGIEASQWRIRSLIMISSFHKFDEKILQAEFKRIFELYKKDKEKVQRILQIQRLDVKKIQEQMKGNQIYLSDHEPEIVSYSILLNYFWQEKLLIDVTDECAQTREVQRSLEVIQSVEKGNFEQFYTEFKNSDYVLSCILVPYVHEIREKFLKLMSNKARLPVNNLYKYLVFDSELELLEYASKHGLTLGKKVSKSKKIEEYILESGELVQQLKKDEKFKQEVKKKRDRSYFLAEPEQDELIDGKWMTRSFFAFGDFKQSINPKYMLTLCKKLKQG